jgi:hypothetical protein
VPVVEIEENVRLGEVAALLDELGSYRSEAVEPGLTHDAFDRQPAPFLVLIPLHSSQGQRIERNGHLDILRGWSSNTSSNIQKGLLMYAVIGRVEIKPDRADEARSMIAEHGVAMLQGMAGATGGHWARNIDGAIIQHSFWLFDTQENARAAETTFNMLREMPDAPATFVSVDVCEVIGQA